MSPWGRRYEKDVPRLGLPTTFGEPSQRIAVNFSGIGGAAEDVRQELHHRLWRGGTTESTYRIPGSSPVRVVAVGGNLHTFGYPPDGSLSKTLVYAPGDETTGCRVELYHAPSTTINTGAPNFTPIGTLITEVPLWGSWIPVEVSVPNGGYLHAHAWYETIECIVPTAGAIRFPLFQVQMSVMLEQYGERG